MEFSKPCKVLLPHGCLKQARRSWHSFSLRHGRPRTLSAGGMQRQVGIWRPLCPWLSVPATTGDPGDLRNLAQICSCSSSCVRESQDLLPEAALPEDILTLGPPLLRSSLPHSSELFGHQLCCFKLLSLIDIGSPGCSRLFMVHGPCGNGCHCCTWGGGLSQTFKITDF